MIPERTLAAGGAGGSGVEDQIDSLATRYRAATGKEIDLCNMQALVDRESWPMERELEDGNGWLHGDIRDMAYVYVWQAYQHMVATKGLND